MDTPKTTAPSPHPPTRASRGVALFRDHGDEIEPRSHGRYVVPGCSGGSYTVDLAVFGGEESCTCPDHRRHPETACKHIHAATLYRARVRMAARKAKSPRYGAASVAANLARMGA